MSLYTPRQQRFLVLALTAALGLLLLWMMRNLLAAFLGAVVLYVLFRPVFAHCIVRWKWPVWMASLTVILLSLLCLVLPFFLVGWMVAGKVQLLLQHTDGLQAVVERIDAYLGIPIESQFNISQLAQFAEKYLFGSLGSVLSGLGSMLFSLGIAYFLLWFMLMNQNRFEKNLIRLMPFSRHVSESFGDELRSSTFGNVIGQGFICLVQGLMLSLGFWIFDLHDPIFWGIITFFLSFIPFLGAPLIFVPAGILALTYGNTTAGYGIMIWGFTLVTNIDTVLRYFISRYFADTHPLITILGVMVGIPVFGILGLVFGPLLISWFLMLVKLSLRLGEEVSN